MFDLLMDTTKKYLMSTEYSMAYNQMVFLAFLGIFLLIYFLILNNTLKKIWILIGNLFFCIWSGWAGVVIVGITCIVTYITSLRIEKVYEQYERDRAGKELKPKEEVLFLAEYKKKAKIYLWIALFFIFGIWILVKIGKLIGMPAVASFGECFSGKGIIVPLGISYYTLSASGYLLDLFWRKSKPVHSFFDLCLAMTYFPHIVQGPISKYSELLPQFDNIPRFDYERVCHGLQLMLWGYMKKMIVADRLIAYTQTIFGDLTHHTGFEVLLAVLFGGVQLYADFSGCMDIVRGISHAMGIELSPNFNQPFFAKSATEFWTRWHMTLNAWTKEYIFLPIATNAKFMKKIRSIKKKSGDRASSFWNSFVPLITVWLFTGLWHGTGIDYMLWGMYWCLLMTLSKETSFIWDKVTATLHINRKKWYHALWQMVRTYFIFIVGKCFTAADGLSGFVLIWKRIFSGISLRTVTDGTIYGFGMDQYDFLVSAIFLLVMLSVDILHEKGVNIRERIDAWWLPLRWVFYIVAILTLIVIGVYGPAFDASKFVYGGF